MIPTTTSLPRIAVMTYDRTIACDSLAEARDVARSLFKTMDVWIWCDGTARLWPH